MRFGVFSVADHYPRELGRTAGELYAEVLEQAEAADELGFDSFWIAEHHFHGYGASTNTTVSASTSRKGARASERYVRTRLYAVQRSFDTLVEQTSSRSAIRTRSRARRVSTSVPVSPISSPSRTSAAFRTSACCAPWN